RRCGFETLAGRGDHAVRWTIRHWWLTIPALELVAVVVAAWVAQAIARPAMRRLHDAIGPGPAPLTTTGTAAAGPVPVSVEDVRHRYPGASTDALAGVSMTVPAGAYVAIVGDTGSGKST